MPTATKPHRRTKPSGRASDRRRLRDQLAGSAKASTSVKDVRQGYGVPRRTFARLIDVSERSLADLEGGKRPNEGVQRRVNEVERLRLALARIIAPDAIAHWLQQPNDAFAGLKPIEVIERGESDRIWRMVFYVESGVPG